MCALVSLLYALVTAKQNSKTCATDIMAKQLHTNLSSYRPVSLRRCAALAMHDKNTGSASIIQVNVHQAIDTGMQRLIAQGIVHKYHLVG